MCLFRPCCCKGKSMMASNRFCSCTDTPDIPLPPPPRIEFNCKNEI